MNYAPSLSEKKEYLRHLNQAMNGMSLASQQVSRAFLLAQMRWETQEIKELETEIRALQR